MVRRRKTSTRSNQRLVEEHPQIAVLRRIAVQVAHQLNFIWLLVFLVAVTSLLSRERTGLILILDEMEDWAILLHQGTELGRLHVLQ